MRALIKGKSMKIWASEFANVCGSCGVIHLGSHCLPENVDTDFGCLIFKLSFLFSSSFVHWFECLILLWVWSWMCVFDHLVPRFFARIVYTDFFGPMSCFEVVHSRLWRCKNIDECWQLPATLLFLEQPAHHIITAVPKTSIKANDCVCYHFRAQ